MACFPDYKMQQGLRLPAQMSWELCTSVRKPVSGHSADPASRTQHTVRIGGQGTASLHFQPQAAEGAAPPPGILGSIKGRPTSDQSEAFLLEPGPAQGGSGGHGELSRCARGARGAGLA